MLGAILYLMVEVVVMRVNEGDFVKWMLPLDNDYSYGKIDSIKKAIALVTHIGGYYDGKQVEVHLKYIQRGGCESGSKAKRRRK